jgi:histone deacetylase 6
MVAGPSAEVSMDVDEDVPASIPVRPRYTSDMRASSLPIKPEEYTVGFVYSLEMMIHYSPHGHPEQPERISRIHDALGEAKCLSKMKRLPIRPVRKEESLLVHSEDHWEKVRDIQSESCRHIRQLDELGGVPANFSYHRLHAYLEICSTTS